MIWRVAPGLVLIATGLVLLFYPISVVYLTIGMIWFALLLVRVVECNKTPENLDDTNQTTRED